MRRRTLILFVGLPLYAIAMMVGGTCLLLTLFIEEWDDLSDYLRAIGEALAEPAWWAYAGVTATVLIGFQAIFLIPMFNARPPRDRRGKSLTVSLLVAALFAGLLMLGLGAAAMELIRLGSSATNSWDELWLLPFGALAVGWGLWSLLLVLYVRGIWADRTLGRIVGILFAGTVIETLVVLPIDIMVRRKTDCYCATGTFVALSVCGLGALWLLGPGVVIALGSRKHRRWREIYCTNCGYAKGPSPGARCAECGVDWA